MAKSFKATWLGDEDPNQQIITMGGVRFIKGEQVTVPDDYEFAEQIQGNPMFAVDNAKAEPVEAIEPEPVDPDEGTERGALIKELNAAGIKHDGRAKTETLRDLLAKG